MEKRRRLRINVHSAKQRPIEELVWCAFCHEVKPIFWKDGKLFCYEMKFYPRRSSLIVIDSCVAIMPNYNKAIRVEGSANISSTVLPIVKASATAEKVLEHALNLLEEQKISKGEERRRHVKP